MNYKPVKYFFSSACGNCSLTWQQDSVQTSPWGWLVGRYAVCMERGAVTWSQAPFLGHVPNVVPKDGENPMAVLDTKREWELLPEQVGKNSSAGSRWEGSGRVRQGKAFLALLLCTGRAVPNNTCAVGISAHYFCTSGTIPLKPMAPH